MKTKIYSLILFLFATAAVTAQTAQPTRILDANEYDRLKSANRLPEKFQLKAADGQTVLMPRIYPSANTIQTNAVCNCLIALDTTFSVVHFSAGMPPDYRNDDGSSAAIVLPFSYCFFGQTIDSIFINNNGNISFDAPRYSWISDSFPNATYSMISPLWADVDTRGPLSGLVYYKVTPTSIIIKWEHVGYFPMQDNLLNTYQVIITDGTDPLVPVGNTAFCYGDVQWTNGGMAFGGNPATAGANGGDGVNFIQFGRFNAPGYGYDGPFGASDSVDWLDSSNFVLDLCPVNVPPLPLDCNNDSVFLRVGDVADIDASFISPEAGRTVTITLNPGALNVTTLSNTAGSMAHYKGSFVADVANLGYNTLTLTATDNAVPPQSYSFNRIYHIDQATGIQPVDFSSSISFSPNPFTNQTVLTIGDRSRKNVSLTICDVMGRQVMRVDHVPSTLVIEKGNLTKGVYFYQLTDTDEMNETGKIVIQ